MTLAPTKTPLVVKKMFPNYIWDIPSTNKTIYLTFDDGPTPEVTNWTLKTLKAYDAKATFFCIGDNVKKHPEIFRNILKDEHAIGNHTYNHIKGWNTKNKDYIANVELCESTIKAQISKTKFQNQKLPTINQKSLITNLFRPPYGKITPKQGKNLIRQGYKVIMWDILSFDWDNSITQEKCLDNVISKSKNGSIIVFHDSIKASKNMTYVLPKVLEYFSNKNYTFNTIKF